MKKRFIILLLIIFFIAPITCDANASDLDLDGVCKITMLKNDHLLLQKGTWRRDGNHTCHSIDRYKIVKGGHEFIETMTCDDGYKLYERYKGDKYERD